MFIEEIDHGAYYILPQHRVVDKTLWKQELDRRLPMEDYFFMYLTLALPRQAFVNSLKDIYAVTPTLMKVNAEITRVNAKRLLDFLQSSPSFLRTHPTFLTAIRETSELFSNEGFDKGSIMAYESDSD